jgi:ABC-2 type transport system permease protein
MSHLANITKKELRELLTPGSLIPVVMVAVIFMFMGSMIGGEVEKASAPVVIGIADADDGVYSDLSIGYIETFYETYYKVPVEDLPEYLITLDSSIYGNDQAILQEMRAKGVTTLLFFGPGFSEDIASKEQATIELYFSEVSTGAFGNMSSQAMTGIISYVNTSLSTERSRTDTAASGEVGAVLNPIGQTQPVTFINGVAYTCITPYEISSAMSSQSMSVPIMIMLIIVMIGSIVISSMGNEKENKTLETLLTLPVDRTTIVSGKLIASAMRD